VKRIAVVGSGIAGLAAARALVQAQQQVTVFEAGSYFGGHANTVDVTLDGVTHGVDTGFLVFNHRTYPHLLQLFAELGVETAPSAMSFSVQVPGQDLEWSGLNLASVFCQRKNLLRPVFWGMLRDIMRFNRITTAIAQRNAEEQLQQPIGEFLQAHRFGQAFRDWYFLPMIACIWSCPTEQMMAFPMSTLIRFCHNHGLLQVANRPQWYTVRGGSRQYVQRVVAQLPDARLNSPVLTLQRQAQGVQITTPHGVEQFDQVVLACHSDQSLALLGDQASADERSVLGAIRYHPNHAVLHTDTALLPQRRSAWAAWNYESSRADTSESAGAESVCLHYLINQLQPLPWQQAVVVSLNPVRQPAPHTVLARMEYAHPVFDQAAVAAQARVPSIQGTANTWFCGAWARYGFHEDGIASGLHAARLLLQAQAPTGGAA
jgi:uncharacterized protein